MEYITLATVNWNQRPALELMLKSYVKYHYAGEPLKILVYDNDSSDDSVKWMLDNNIPFTKSPTNIGHENALNVIYKQTRTKYLLVVDTDIEFKVDTHEHYLPQLDPFVNIAAGEYIDWDRMGDSKIKPRLSPWFFLFDIKKMKELGVTCFRDPNCTDWSYDVGSWLTEKIIASGYTFVNIPRLPSDQDRDPVGMKYKTHDHFTRVSWNLENHMDRHDEVMMRREHILSRLEEYKDIVLRDKFML